LKNVEQDLGGAPIGFGRLVDELCDDGLTLGDLAAPAILGDNDEFIERLA
jgi:hypothetical protein